MRCLITGGTGFIGSHIVRKLRNEGAEVAVLLRPDRVPRRINELVPSLKLLYGDLGNIHEIKDQIKAYKPEVVVHAGWGGVVKDKRNDFDQQIKTNLNGSLEFLKICVEAGCSNWIGLGSQAEYGPTNEVLVEDLHPNPDTLYGAAKLSLGILSQVFCKSVSVRQVWLRLTAAYGPMDDPSHLIPYVITTLIKNEVPALTRGEQRWDYLYIDDIVNAVWLTIMNEDVKGIFNLSAGKSTEIRKLCESIRNYINAELLLGFDQIPYREEERMVLLASNQRFCQTARWSPITSLEEGLEMTIDWYARQAIVK